MALTRLQLGFILAVLTLAVGLALIWHYSGQATLSLIAALGAMIISLFATFVSIHEEPRLAFGSIESTGERVRVRIKNDGPGTARACYGKLSIDNDTQDLLAVNQSWGFPAYMFRDQSSGRVNYASVAWEQSPNPVRLDIGSLDDESLMIARLLPVQGQTIIEIPSEEGESVQPVMNLQAGVIIPERKARAFLRPRGTPYRVTVRIGSSSTSKPIEKIYLLDADTKTRSLSLKEA